MNPLTSPLKRLFATSLLALLAACAAVQQHPAAITLLAPGAAAVPVSLVAPLQVELDTGYTRAVKAGSQWLRVGAIAQGDVFKPYQDVFTLEGAHIHEAYLVVDKGVLVGFYLPAERSFSPLKHKKSVSFQ